MPRDDAASLLDVILAARSIANYVKGTDAKQFQLDELRQSAVIYQLMVMGEATKRLSEEFRTAHPEIPWSEIARMRDFLIHSYHKVEIDQVTSAAFDTLPPVLQALEKIAPKEPE